MKKLSFSFWLFLSFPAILLAVNFLMLLIKKVFEYNVLIIFGLVVVLINSFFFYFLKSKEKELAYFFQGTALFVMILMFIFLLAATQ